MDADQKVRAWLERELGGTVVAFDRQARWRPAWFADVSRDGRLRRYYVRGSRGGNFLEMITLAQEADVNRVLLKHGVPVPAVHGMIDDPPAIIMDRLPGRANLATAGRWALEAIAQVVGVPLEVLSRPGEGPSSSSYWHASYQNLLSVLDELPGSGDGAGNSAADRARAVTRFAEHVHAFGRSLEAAEAQEISEILGVRQPDIATAEAALEEFVLTASPDRDAELVRYFHRWTQRQQFLIEGTGARHEELIHISPQPLTGWN